MTSFLTPPSTRPVGRNNSLTRTPSGSGGQPDPKKDASGGLFQEILGRRPSTAGSGTTSSSRPDTPMNVTMEGLRVREMMKQRLTRRISDHRRSSVVQQEAAIAEFHRRHNIVLTRQIARAMYNLFKRKARAVAHLIYWFKMWRKEVEENVRKDDWFLFYEKLMADSSEANQAEMAANNDTGEFVTLMPVNSHSAEPTNYVELRFNKRDFAVDRKSLASCLSLKAREYLAKPSESRSNEEILEIARCLKKLPNFQQFPLALQKEIAHLCIFDSYEKNRVLWKCGGRPDGFFIVLFGTLILRPKSSSGTTENKFANIGQIYGEDEVMLGLPRSYTAVTREDNTEVLYIYREDYLDAKDRLEGRCRVDDVRETFSAHPTLRLFEFDKLGSEAKTWQTQTFQPGSIIASHEREKAIVVDASKKEVDFSVSNIAASDLLDAHLLAKEKAKYFCVVQKGSADVYGVCKESEERKQQRQTADPYKTRMRLLNMLHPDENEWRKMNKHYFENDPEYDGLTLLLPEKWDRTSTNRELDGKVPRRFQRSTPFTADPQLQPGITMAPVSYSKVKPGDPPPNFVQQFSGPGSGKVEKTYAKIGKAEPGTVFGMESAVTAALEPWLRDSEEAGPREKAFGVNQRPDVFFVSNGCQVILVNKSVYEKGLARDARCLTASQMPTYHDKNSILTAKDDNDAWKVEKDRLRAHYQKIMANSKKTKLTL